jgi:invasion protein IalB
MRALPTLLLALPAVALSAAVPAWAAGPKSIGAFERWQAATYEEGGQTVCYAFTKARTSNPKIPGRGEAVLTITQRPNGRDQVALSAGFEFAPNATVELQVDKQKPVELYTAKRSAFARDGHALVAAFEKGTAVTTRSPHPQKNTVTDTFGLQGFTKAYEATVKACPPPKG